MQYLAMMLVFAVLGIYLDQKYTAARIRHKHLPHYLKEAGIKLPEKEKTINAQDKK